MTPREKADRAKQILEDPVFNQALADVRERFVQKIEANADFDPEADHAICMALRNLKATRLQLLRYTDEIVLDNAVERNASWMRRAKALMP